MTGVARCLRGTEGGGGGGSGDDAGDPARAAAERAAGFHLRVGTRWGTEREPVGRAEERGALGRGLRAPRSGLSPSLSLHSPPPPPSLTSHPSQIEESNELSGVCPAAQSNLGPTGQALTRAPGPEGGREGCGRAGDRATPSWQPWPAQGCVL